MAPILIGSNHRLTPPSRLQSIASRKEAIFARLLSLKVEGKIDGAIMLATCNRLEIFLDARDLEPDELTRTILGEALTIPVHQLRDEEAVHHLLRVATGLESMVLGEDQVLGQLREAFKLAEKHELLSPALRVLRSKLTAAARDARGRTGMCKTLVSVASLAARQLERAGPRLAVVGAGETGRLAVETLVKRGFRDLMIVNRSYARAAALAEHFGVRAMALKEFLARGHEFELDGVLFAVHSKKPLFNARLAKRLEGLRMIVDVSMPSVLEPGIKDLPELEVLDLDAIAGLVTEESERRSSALNIAAEIIRAKAHSICESMSIAQKGKAPSFASVVEQHVGSAMQEIESALGTKLRHLSISDQDQIRRIMVRITKRSAHYHLQDLKVLTKT